ncbi:MAG: SPASM domain-containing protein, partial [Candidatus Bathyarchaeia archaeon]
VLYDFLPIGRGRELASVGMSQEQWTEMLDYIRKIQEEMGILFLVSGGEPLYPGLILELHKQWETSPPDKFLRPFLIHSRVGCHAAIHYFSLRSNGDVYPCPFMHISAGNIREHSLTEIWYNSKLFTTLRQRSLLKGKCGSCAYRENCGGCRARAYIQTGDYMESDPNCPLELLSKKRINLSSIECFGLCVG